MVWKNTLSTDGGNAKVWGGRDHDKFARLLNGELNVDNVAINLPTSKWEFETLALLLRNRASAYGYNIVVPTLSGIGGHIQLSLPSGLVTNDTLMTLASSGRMKNKTVDLRENTFIGLGSSGAASGSKTGDLVCGKQLGSAAGRGLLAGHIDRPASPVSTSDPAPVGNYWEYSSTTSQNTVTGIEYPWTITRRQYNPRFKAKIRVPTSAANSRLYVGLSSDISMEASDTPVSDTESAIVVGWRSIDSTIRIFHNNGAGAGAVAPAMFDTGIPKNTNLRTISVACRNQTPEIEVVIAEPSDIFGNETNVQTFLVTTKLPLEGTNLAPTCTLSNSDGADHKFWVGGLEMDQTM